MRQALLSTSLATLFACCSAAADPQPKRGEFLQMLDAVWAGSQMGPGDGWFKPSQSRYSWDRFKTAFDGDKDNRISAKELGSTPEIFASLDRDGDGIVTAEDLDWSENSAYARQMSLAVQILRRNDQNADRKLSKEEWLAIFDKASKGGSTLDAEAMRRIVFPPSPSSMAKKGGGGPSRETLLLGLLTGELGSGAEGPQVDSMAPDFTLGSPDGKTTITLGDFRGKKPVVLIFGSFT